MKKRLEKILVVEDNWRYLEAAEEFFRRKNLKVSYVSNYSDAVKNIRKRKHYDGLMIDLFIPESEEERIGKRGEELLKEFKNKLKEFSEIYNLSEKTLNLYELMIKAENNEELKKLIKNSVNLLPLKIRNLKYSRAAHSLQFLEREEKKNKAPLGILIAKIAERFGIPYVYVSDAGHVKGHGILGPGIWAVYYSDIMDYESFVKIFVDTRYGEKSSKEFWKNAYEILKEIYQNGKHV